MAQDEKIFADGFSFKRNEKAPDFVVGRMSMKVDEAVAFIRQHEKNGWVSLNIKTARSGNHYVELDTYEPNQSAAKAEQKPKPAPAPTDAPADGEDDDLPF
jgi:single-stranded DNA-binding protein